MAKAEPAISKKLTSFVVFMFRRVQSQTEVNCADRLVLCADQLIVFTIVSYIRRGKSPGTFEIVERRRIDRGNRIFQQQY